MRYLLVIVLVACSKPAPPPAPEPTPAPVASAPNAPPKKPSTPSYVSFDKGRLFECIDVKIDGDAGLPKDVFKDAQKIEQTCAEQFPDRAVLASCTVERSKGTITSSFYDFADVGLDDQQMSDCLEMKGKWHAVSRDSKEWLRAKLEHDTRALQKTVAKANAD